MDVELERQMNRIMRDSEIAEGWIWEINGQRYFVLNHVRLELTN